MSDEREALLFDPYRALAIKVHVGAKIDPLCVWLVRHRCSRVAVLIWKAFRLW